MEPSSDTVVQQSSYLNFPMEPHKVSALTEDTPNNIIETKKNIFGYPSSRIINDYQNHSEELSHLEYQEELQYPIYQSSEALTTLNPKIIEFEKNKKRVMDKLVRSDIQKPIPIEEEIKEVFGVDEDPIICSTDLYAKDQIGWKNRQMKQLSIKYFAGLPISDITKIKIQSNRPMIGYYIIRLNIGDDELHEYAIRESCLRHWFANTTWACLLSLGVETSINQHFKGEFSGWILKRSQILGKWEERWVVINNIDGLTSSHSPQQQATVIIQNTRQIWTRLELIEDKNYIVLKLWQCFFKREFAVPIETCISWFKAFSSLITNKNQS